MKQLNTYLIEGGIGKGVAFTALIPKLVEKAGQPIQIYSPYIDSFANNPNIKMVFNMTTIPQTDKRLQESDNIYYCEPYKSNFIKGKEHLIESYCNLFGIEYKSNMIPKLYTEKLKPRATDWLKRNRITGKYMMIQFTGGQSPIGFNGNNQYNSTNPPRNYPPVLGQTVVNLLKNKYPDLTIIDCTLPNEPGYQNTIKCNEHWIVIHEMLKEAEGFISIDSCLNHFSPSAKKVGVVIWGNTRWTQFGYSHNRNLHFHMKDKWDNTKFTDTDPRNVMVDPEIVFNAYINRGKLVKNQTPEPFCLST